MGDETCEVCGYHSKFGAVGKHHVIPNEVTQQAGLSEVHTIRMCCNCRWELDTWYSARVAKLVYDTKTQRFRDRTWREVIEEYQSVFNGFVNYKKGRNKVH